MLKLSLYNIWEKEVCRSIMQELSALLTSPGLNVSSPIPNPSDEHIYAASVDKQIMDRKNLFYVKNK